MTEEMFLALEDRLINQVADLAYTTGWGWWGSTEDHLVNITFFRPDDPAHWESA